MTLVQDSTVVAESLLREVVVQLPESGGADSDLVVSLWQPGELSGPAIIEVTGTFQLDAGTLPVTDALTSGALLWYEQSIVTAPPVRPPSGAAPQRSGPVPGDVVVTVEVRWTPLAFEAVASGDTAERLGVELSGPLDSARFVDTAAARHGMQLRWFYLDGDNSLGFPEELDSACAFVGPFGWAALPPRDSAHLSNGQPHGEVRIRVYRARLESLNVAVTIDSQVIPPWIPAVGFHGCAHRFAAIKGGTTPIKVVVTKANGQSAAGATITVDARFVARSGGHDHQTADEQGFTRLKLATDTGRGTLAHFQGTTDSLGTLSLSVLADSIGGWERLIFTATAGGRSGTRKDSVQIAIAGLGSLPESNDYGLIGNTGTQGLRHLSNHWANGSVNIILDSVARLVRQKENPQPSGPRIIMFNDMSVVGGGLFDIAGDFVRRAVPGHLAHDRGVDVDVDDALAGGDSLAFSILQESLHAYLADAILVNEGQSLSREAYRMPSSLKHLLVVATLSSIPGCILRAQADSFPIVSIQGASVTCTRAVQTGSVFEYVFLSRNPATSTAGLAKLAVDVSAPVGLHPSMLTGTASFLRDGTLAIGALSGHVPVGMDSAGLWIANITPDGFAQWFGWGPGLTVTDPIRPDSAREFVLRSTHLPGIRAFRLLPEYPHLCCPYEADDPRNDSIAVHTASEFQVTGSTLGPRYAPEALLDVRSGLDSVARDLTQACSLGWIADASLCGALSGRVQQASQDLGVGDNVGARAQLDAVVADLDARHGPGLPVNDNAFWLLKTNVEFILSHIRAGGTGATVYLTGSGGAANPPTLSLSADAPAGTTAKYKDSPAVNFNAGNPWAAVGTWTAVPSLTTGTLTALGDTHVWLGLKNSDDIGTNFDVRIEALKNGTVVTAGETRCMKGLTRNANRAQPVAVPLAAFPATTFNGTSDVLSLKVLTRVGTTATGAWCGGHSDADGLRVYFDATSRVAQLTTTF